MKQKTQCILLAACLLGGCKSAPVAIAPPPSGPAFVVSSTRAESTAALVDRNVRLSSEIAQFPGDNAAEHRTILVPVLEDLSKALRLANGPVQSPEFTNRIAVIDSARATASIVELPPSHMHAVETQALLAAAAALDEITERYLFDDDQLPPMLDGLDSDVNKASLTVGPLHDLDSTHAFRTIEVIISRMTDDMVERFGTVAPPPLLPPGMGPAPMGATPTTLPAPPPPPVAPTPGT